MIKDKPINVYWAPFFEDKAYDWNILYSEPKILFDVMMKNKIDKGSHTFFSCPAVKNLMKNIYVFNNTVESEYRYDFTKNNKVFEAKSSKSLTYIIQREPQISNGPLILFNMAYIFFSEEPLITTFSSPYFSMSKYMESGSFVPGEFDIGKWFRPYMCEMQMWSNNGSIKFEHDEPLVYVKFNTDKNIKLQRFEMNEKLYNIVRTGVNTQYWYKTKNTLNTYYYLFNRSKMRNIILKEIKNNLVSEEL